MDYGAGPMPRWPLVLLCAACARALPPPPPLPPPRLPPGCEASLAGPWVLASDPGWRYLARDDGGTLELLVTQAGAPPDAGWRPRRFLARPDAGTDGDAGHPAAGDPRGVPGEPGAAGREAQAAAPGSTDGDAGRPAGEVPRGPPGEPGAPVRDSAAGGAPVRLVLERTPGGLVGLTRVPAPGGCAAVFRTEVLGCEDGGLVLRSQASLAVGEGCAAAPGPDRVDRLVR